MTREFPGRRETPANANEIVENEGARDPRSARDVAPGTPWAFFEHRTLAEVFAAERQS